MHNHAEESVRDLAEERGLDDVLAALDVALYADKPDEFANLLIKETARLRLDGTGYEGEVEAAAAAPLEEAVPLEAAEEL